MKSAQERALDELSKTVETRSQLLSRIADLERELDEAVWLLSNSERSRRIGWNERRDALLTRHRKATETLISDQEPKHLTTKTKGPLTT